MNGFEMMFNNIVDRAKETANIVEGDYVGEDNLYYCGKCKTKKQTVITMFGKTKIVPCICECKAAEIKAEEEARKEAQYLERIRRLRKNAFSEEMMQNWTFENSDGADPKMVNAMKNYTKHFQELKDHGKGLLLFGPVGTGKTYLAACIANELINQNISCLVTNFAKIANDVQNLFEGRQQYYNYLNSFSLLIIDDLSAERKTDYMQEIVFNVIDARYRANLPLIVTTNLTREELMMPATITQQRIFSRLFEMCVPIEVAGVDRRKKTLKNDIGKIKNLLGLE